MINLTLIDSSARVERSISEQHRRIADASAFGSLLLLWHTPQSTSLARAALPLASAAFYNTNPVLTLTFEVTQRCKQRVFLLSKKIHRAKKMHFEKNHYSIGQKKPGCGHS